MSDSDDNEKQTKSLLDTSNAEYLTARTSTMSELDGGSDSLPITADSETDIEQRLKLTEKRGLENIFQQHVNVSDEIGTAEEEYAEIVEGAKALAKKVAKRDDPKTKHLVNQLLNNVKDTKSVVESKNPRANEELVQQVIAIKSNEEKLNVVIAEYEKTIAKLIRDNACIIKERDTFQVHLANVEAAFSDVHQKYERCKVVIEGFKNNEQILKETIKANEDSILKLNNKYEALKTHAMGQLEKANNELIEMKKNHEDEILRLTATVKKLELKNSSLKSAVDQRMKECEELSRICDDLISKVGR